MKGVWVCRLHAWELALNCAARYFDFRPRGICLRQGRKTKDDSRSVTCAAACLGYLSMCRLFWSHAKSLVLLGGTLGEMRPGASVMAHPRRGMAVDCHRPRAQRGTSCSAVTGASSAALRGGECLAPSHFFHEPFRPRQAKSDCPTAGDRGAALNLLSIVESTKPKQVYDVKLDFVSERTIKEQGEWEFITQVKGTFFGMSESEEASQRR